MRRKMKIATGVGTIMLVALSIGPASAKTARSGPPEVAWTGANIHVKPDGSAAYVLGKYRCFGGREGTHLWVSVKQGPNLSEPDRTSSGDAAAWYDTNWNFQNSAAGLTVDCNGHWHTTRYELRREFGDLHDGRAFVQFCLFDSSGSEETGFAFDYSWKPVRVP